MHFPLLTYDQYASYSDSLLQLARCPMKTNVFTFGFGANPWAKFTKRGDGLLPIQVYRPAKYHRHTSTYAGDIRYRSICEQNKTKQTKLQTNSKRHIPSIPIL